jgi:NAD(P)-dependent dehydrogenase (short-subunit alcohol dehydrogenase family)
MSKPAMSDKTAVVTGASRGVGEHLARALARDGANVVVHYHTHRESADALVAEITSLGGRAVACGGDVSEPGDVKTLLSAALDTFGGVDILINNAGINIDGPLLEMREQDWSRVLDVNLKGPFLCTQAFGRIMVDAGAGKILNISAVTSVQARPGAANYCSSKAGLNMLTKCSALELAPAVQVNGMALGYFQSRLVQENFTESQLQAVCEQTPLGRMGHMNELEQLALFLVSGGSNFVTGQTIVIDGGRVMQ